MDSYTLTFSRCDLIELAMSVTAAASASYNDERLATAVGEYAMAARLFATAGYVRMAADRAALSCAIRQEIAELAAGAMEDA